MTKQRHAHPAAPANEIRVLLLVARIELNPRQQEQLRSLLAAVNWDELIVLADRHGVLGLLHWHMQRAATGSLPAEWAYFVGRWVQGTAASGLDLTGELVRIVSALAERGIIAVPYKGPVVARQLYGNLALRAFNDLDILVREQEIGAAAAVLEALGYRATFGFDPADPRRPSAPGQYAFVHREQPRLVELHTEATLRYFPVRADFGEFWQRLRPLSLGGANISTLAAEDLLLFLCVHGAKDFWERLVWIADVAQLVRQYPGLDWEAALARAERYGAGRIVRLGLALALELLEAPLPEAVAARVRADAAAGSLAQQICRQLFTAAGGFEGLARRFWFRVRLHGRLGGGVRYAARLVSTPTEEDWEAVRLPRPLQFLYPLVRLVRLAGKYGARLLGRGIVADLGKYEPTPEEVVLRMLELAEVKPSDVVYDLGCGDGRCVVLAAKKFGARGVGVDADARRVAEARQRVRREGVADRVRILRQDVRRVNLREATVVLLALRCTAHLQLRQKLRQELPAGARIVALWYPLGDWVPERSEEFADASGQTKPLFLWRT